MPARSLTFDEIMCRYVPSEGGLGCWDWEGHIDKFGYGKITWQYTGYLAHRLIYTHLVGPIPEGLEIDHLCRNRSCVNPDHLEPVEHVENVRRAAAIPNNRPLKTHCKHGHAFTEPNTYVRPNGDRVCRTCYRARDRARARPATDESRRKNREYQRAYKARKKAEKEAQAA